MACCHHVRTMVSGLVIHFTLNFLKEAMGAALPRQSQILLLSKPTFKCLLLPMLRRPNTFCYETCFWFILCFFFFFELLTFVLFARALEHSAQLKPHGCRSVFFFFFLLKKIQFLCPKYIVLRKWSCVACSDGNYVGSCQNTNRYE